LAEDNALNQEIALAMLDEVDFLVEVVGNGREALAALVGAQFDVVLMDCQMPEMDGFEAVRRLRLHEREHDIARTPVIALTANAISGDRELCLAAGMDDYVSKPFKREALLTALGRWTHAPLDKPDQAAVQSAAPQPDAQSASLDPAALQALRALQKPGRPNILNRVIDLYCQDGPRLLAAMRAAVEAGDMEALRHAAHTLKSSSGNVGAAGLAASCRTIEQLARDHDTSELNLSFDQTAQELDRILAELVHERAEV